MFKPFDSYVEDGEIIIITTDFDEEGKRAVQLNSIRIERAKEILKDLQEAITSFEKSAIDEKVRLRKEKENNCPEREYRSNGGKWSSATQRSCINCGLTLD